VEQQNDLEANMKKTATFIAMYIVLTSIPARAFDGGGRSMHLALLDEGTGARTETVALISPLQKFNYIKGGQDLTIKNRDDKIGDRGNKIKGLAYVRTYFAK
jgi:hypothetical protein